MLQDVVARDPFRYCPMLLGARARYFRLRVFTCGRSGGPGHKPGQARDTLDRVEAAFELRAQARETGQCGEALTDVREAIALVSVSARTWCPPTR